MEKLCRRPGGLVEARRFSGGLDVEWRPEGLGEATGSLEV